MATQKKKKQKANEKNGLQNNSETFASKIELAKGGGVQPQSSMLLSQNFEPVEASPMKSFFVTFLSAVVTGAVVGSLPLGYGLYKDLTGSGSTGAGAQLDEIASKMSSHHEKTLSEIVEIHREMKLLTKKLDALENQVNTPKLPKVERPLKKKK